MLNNSDHIINQYKAKLLEYGYQGEFHADYSTRLLNATDNSIYELMPQAVAQPRNIEDLQILVKVANLDGFKSLCFVARGGGTGTNGQSLTKHIVIDFSRWMTRILEFDQESQTVTVEAGIILSELNNFLKPYNLFFAPHVSTGDRATIGGMIATDAAGKGSLIYGKTSDHILSTKLILADGTTLNTKKIELAKLDRHSDVSNNENDSHSKREQSNLMNLFKQVVDLLKPVQDEINLRFPPLKRPLSGYNIKQCYQNGRVDLNRLIAGSEGTLGLVATATLKLLPIPKCKTLVVVHYPTFQAALRDANHLIKHQPLAIEAIDEKVQKSAQSLPNWLTLAKWLNSEGKNYISNFVEFVAETKEELQHKIANLAQDLNTSKANYVIITDSNQINQLWLIRSLAVGLAGKMPGVSKPVAFIEDAIVPPEHLADFVADLEQMLDLKQLDYAMYGHVDVGCIHVRPTLDLQAESDRQKIRPITLDVIKLLNKYHGVLWGEHGKGFRGEFIPDVFGPILYDVLCQIKTLFDPYNRLNPGKLTNPNPHNQLDKIDEVPMRGQFDQVISQEMQQQFSDSILCNGNAACFNVEASNVMCPSYKVTGDRIHSPKGRAMLTKEWLREQAKGEGRDAKIADMTFTAMNGCLGCKGCSGKCPTGVSIPDLRSKFLNEYYTKYKKRKIGDLLSGYIEHLLPFIAKFPKTWNFLNRNNLMPTFGMTHLPLFSNTKPLRKILREQKIALYPNPSAAEILAENAVVIYTDVFTGFLDASVLFATINVLKQLGYMPYVMYPRPSGKALIVGGFISKFKENASKLSEWFEPLFRANIPVIGLENSVVLMFRDEINKFADKPFSGQVQTIAEFLDCHYELSIRHCKQSETISSLSRGLESIKSNLDLNKLKHILLPHCTEQALQPQEAHLWQKIYAKSGIALEVKNLGCCGMAGTYGYQKQHQQNSQKLFAMHWRQSVANVSANSNNSQVLATGFSCRAQIHKQAGKTISHPIEFLSQVIA